MRRTKKTKAEIYKLQRNNLVKSIAKKYGCLDPKEEKAWIKQQIATLDNYVETRVSK